MDNATMVVVTDADIFADFADVPALEPALRTEIAEQRLNWSDAQWAAYGQEQRDAMDELEWIRQGGA